MGWLDRGFEPVDLWHRELCHPVFKLELMSPYEVSSSQAHMAEAARLGGFHASVCVF